MESSSNETRLLIAPETANSQTPSPNAVGRFFSLPHPKSGKSTCYLLTNSVLQELHCFKQPYTSWFIGDYVCQDGSLYMATPVDPVFILLPLFEEARMKKGDDAGKFRQLDEIMFVAGHPEYQHLMSIAEDCMQVICDVKEVGSSKFFRLNDSKILAWLYCKACQLKQVLPSLDKNYAAQDEKTTLANAVMIMSEYLKDEPWLKLLCSHLKLNLQELTRKVQETENCMPTVECTPMSSSTSQGKGQQSKKTTKQNKKAKVETGSRNIKDMFLRSSKRS